MKGPRRTSREVALQVLYQMDANAELTPDQALRLFFDQLADSDEDETPGPRTTPRFEKAWVERHVRGVAATRQQLDEQLGAVSRNWRIERMSRLDRNILRLALHELVNDPDVAPQIVINEAVELAKRFGTSEAPAFVNGILDSALRARR